MKWSWKLRAASEAVPHKLYWMCRLKPKLPVTTAPLLKFKKGRHSEKGCFVLFFTSSQKTRTREGWMGTLCYPISLNVSEFHIPFLNYNTRVSRIIVSWVWVPKRIKKSLWRVGWDEVSFYLWGSKPLLTMLWVRLDLCSVSKCLRREVSLAMASEVQTREKSTRAPATSATTRLEDVIF